MAATGSGGIVRETRCPDCDARVPGVEGPVHPYLGTSPGCWAIYGEVLAREYGDARYFAAHRLTVDTYAAQHPGRRERRSSQSVNVHLVALHLVLERNAAPAYVRRVLSALAQRHQHEFEWLEPPATLGEVTVVDVLRAATPDEHCALVRRWAESVYAAWAPRRQGFLRYLP